MKRRYMMFRRRLSILWYVLTVRHWMFVRWDEYEDRKFTTDAFIKSTKQIDDLVIYLCESAYKVDLESQTDSAIEETNRIINGN